MREYRIAGPLHYILNRIPTPGEHIDPEQLRYEVADMDGNRVEKEMVKRIPSDPPN